MLIVSVVEHAMLIIGVNLCLLVLRPRGSIVLQESCIMSALGILWSAPPVHISGGRHWKALSLVWNLLFLLSVGLVVVWWRLLLRKPHSWALSFTACSVGSSFSLLCLVSLRLGAILWSSELLSSWVCFSILIRVGVLIRLGVFPLFQKRVSDIIAPKLSIIFLRLIRLGSLISGTLAVC